MTDKERLKALAADAHVNRSYAQHGDTVPTIDELEQLAREVVRLNSEGSYSSFIDAQANYIDALTVALESNGRAVRAAALEEAAQIADRQQYTEGLIHPDHLSEDIERVADARARAIAAAIRAAKEQI